MSPRLDIAIVGSGVAGLGAAWLLAKRHNVKLYEKQARFGGHTNTVTAAARGLDGSTRELPVDTGFIVYNDATYPDLIALFDHLGIASETSNMSFSASIDRGRVEYSGGSWTGLFAQKRNLVRLDHWRMLGDCVRFFRDARVLCARARAADPDLGTFLRHGGYSRAFVDNHLLPMAAAIWSCPVSTMMAFPAPEPRALLQQSRAAAAVRPSLVAHGQGRQPRLSRAAAGRDRRLRRMRRPAWFAWSPVPTA